jgi:hypothetical protein
MDTLGTFPCFPAYRRNAYGAHARERCKAATPSNVSRPLHTRRRYVLKKLEKRHPPKTEAFYRKLIPPEEDSRASRTQWSAADGSILAGGYRESAGAC